MARKDRKVEYQLLCVCISCFVKQRLIFLKFKHFINFNSDFFGLFAGLSSQFKMAKLFLLSLLCVMVVALHAVRNPYDDYFFPSFENDQPAVWPKFS